MQRAPAVLLPTVACSVAELARGSEVQVTAGDPPDPLATALRVLLRDVVRQVVREAMVEALAELRDVEAQRPALLTIEQLCQQLSCSRSMINKLRAEGMPMLMFGDSPRAELSAVLAWLRDREGAPAKAAR